jgi:phage terminase large subunit
MPRTLTIEVPRAFRPLLQPARYKGAWGGRGSAKSWFFASQLVSLFVRQPDTRFACIREVQKSLDQSVKRLIEDTIQRLEVGHLFRVLNTHIESGTDGRIIFQGMQNHTADTIKSLEGYSGAWVEEAQSLSQRSLDLLRPTIRAEGSELWLSWNPRFKTDPVDALLRGDHPHPDSVVVKSTYRDNPWLPDVLKREMEWDKARDPEKYAHIWLGEYERHSEARVFRNWRVDHFETPDNAVFYYGGDWGFATDPTVLVRCFLAGRTLYVDREVYRVGCEIDQTPALFDTLDSGAARRWVITADSARPETISYMQRHGYPHIRSARKGAGSVEDGIEFLRSYDIVVHPRCVHTIDELTLYSYKTDKLTGQILPVLEDSKNHVIDALRYAVESVRANVSSFAAILARKR